MNTTKQNKCFFLIRSISGYRSELKKLMAQVREVASGDDLLDVELAEDDIEISLIALVALLNNIVDDERP